MKVTLVAYTPNPDAVCNMAARTCTSSECPELSLEDDKIGALKHALASGHESVAEHAVFTFQVEGVSRVTEIQLVRHRLASYSIQSGRYCDRKASEFIIPESIKKAMESELMNGGGWDPNGCLESDLNELKKDLDAIDDRMKKLGIPAEDRRYLYPQGIPTNIIITVNARELRHMAEERMCVRAQKEIRELVTRMVELAREVAPVLFGDVGAKCEMLGYCPEQKGCGRYPDLMGLGEEYWIGYEAPEEGKR